MYDNTIKNVKVELCEDKTSLSKINDSNTIDGCSTISSKNSKKTERQKYGNFLKSSTLFNGHLIQDTSIEKEEETAKDSVYIPLTDEQLYKACDGYKTTRHDLLNGKLERIAQQDRMFQKAISNVFQLDTNLVNENTMTHRKTAVEIDTEESEDPEKSQEMVGENTLQHETKDFVIKSKSARKSHKKKLNKLTQQFSICSLKKNTDSNFDSQSAFYKALLKLSRCREEKKSQLNIKSGKCSKKRNKNKRKKSLEQKTHISYNILNETSIDIQDKLKNTAEDVHLSKSKSSSLEKNNEIITHIYLGPSYPSNSNSHNLNNKADKDIHQIKLSTNMARKKNIQQRKTGWQYSDVGENNFDPLLHNKDIKIKRKTHQQKQIKKQLEKIIDAENFCTDDLNNVIKKLTTFDLTEEVNTNALKKKLTQTHLTPV